MGPEYIFSCLCLLCQKTTADKNVTNNGIQKMSSKGLKVQCLKSFIKAELEKLFHQSRGRKSFIKAEIQNCFIKPEAEKQFYQRCGPKLLSKPRSWSGTVLVGWLVLLINAEVISSKPSLRKTVLKHSSKPRSKSFIKAEGFTNFYQSQNGLSKLRSFYQSGGLKGFINAEDMLPL